MELKVNHTYCKCSGCNKYFKSVSAFDKHRYSKNREPRRCLSDEEMIKKGMAINSSGYWISEAWDGVLRNA